MLNAEVSYKVYSLVVHVLEVTRAFVATVCFSICNFKRT